MSHEDGPARFQFHATWTVELPSGFDLAPIGPGKVGKVIQLAVARMLDLAGATGRVGAVSVTCQQATDHQPEPETGDRTIQLEGDS